jgi:hypothetical protein
MAFHSHRQKEKVDYDRAHYAALSVPQRRSLILHEEDIFVMVRRSRNKKRCSSIGLNAKGTGDVAQIHKSHRFTVCELIGHFATRREYN